MTAGSGSEPSTVIVLEGSAEADLRTAVALEKSNSRAREAIANSRTQSLDAVTRCLQRYQSRSDN
jgi:hypothetical protein